MNVPFYTSTREYAVLKNEFDDAVQKVFEKGDFILGNSVSEFEKEAAQYSGVSYAVGVANGSDALVIASDIMEFGKGAEVLTPVFTFFASASCIARLGGIPVFCDIEEDTYCMNMNEAAAKITQKTKGLLPVHLFLQTADMTACMKLAKENRLSVIEDAAEAFGMKTFYGNEWKTAGTIGNFGVYSFFPTKTLGGYGDGGMLVTNDEELYEKAKSYRVHGAVKKYHHDYIGYNSRLDTLQAAILKVKLKYIDKAIKKRGKHASQYIALLSGIPEIQLPVVREGNIPVFYVFTIKAEKRNDLAVFL